MRQRDDMLTPPVGSVPKEQTYHNIDSTAGFLEPLFLKPSLSEDELDFRLRLLSGVERMLLEQRWSVPSMDFTFIYASNSREIENLVTQTRTSIKTLIVHLIGDYYTGGSNAVRLDYQTGARRSYSGPCGLLPNCGGHRYRFISIGTSGTAAKKWTST